MVCLHLYTMTNPTTFLPRVCKTTIWIINRCGKMFESPLLVDVHMYLYLVQILAKGVAKRSDRIFGGV